MVLFSTLQIVKKLSEATQIAIIKLRASCLLHRDSTKPFRQQRIVAEPNIKCNELSPMQLTNMQYEISHNYYFQETSSVICDTNTTTTRISTYHKLLHYTWKFDRLQIKKFTDAIYLLYCLFLNIQLISTYLLPVVSTTYLSV